MDASQIGKCEKCGLVILPHKCPEKIIIKKVERKMVYDEMTGEMKNENYDNGRYAKDGGNFYDAC